MSDINTWSDFKRGHFFTTPEVKTTWVTHDIVWDTPLGEFLATLGNGRVVTFKAQGPGGGNPFVVVEFPTREEAEEWWQALNPGEE